MQGLNGAPGRITYSSIAYVGMIVLRPHVPGLQFGGKSITFEDPYQGLLYHYLIAHFLCYGCFNSFFTIPGLSNAQVPADPSRPNENLQKSNCQRVFEASSQKEEELMKYLTDRNMPLPDFSAHFFKTSLEIPILRGDNPTSQDHDDFEPFHEFDFSEGAELLDIHNGENDSLLPPPPPAAAFEAV